MYALTLIFSVLMSISLPVHGSITSNCPVELPMELFLDCKAAEYSAQTDEQDTGYFSSEYYNLTENLQAWVDRQMELNAASESAGESEESEAGVAQQIDEN